MELMPVTCVWRVGGWEDELKKKKKRHHHRYTPTHTAHHKNTNLLEKRNQNGHRQLGAILFAEQHAAAARFGFDRRRDRPRDLSHLFLHFGPLIAARPAQHAQRVFGEAAQVQGGGRVGQEDRAEQQNRSRHTNQPQRDAPPVGQGRAQHAVVDELGGQDAERGGQLEQDVDGTTQVARRHFAQVERNGGVAKPDPHAQQDAANDDHGHVHRARGQGAPDEEEEGGGADDGAAAVAAGQWGRDQGRKHAGDVE